MYLLAITDHVNNGRAAAFLHAPAGFVLQRGDAALLVARAWVFVHGFSVGQKIFLKSIQHGRGFIEDGPALAAAQQHALRAEHFRHLGEDGAAAPCTQHIAEPAHRRVCGDAGKAVAAAAFHAHHKLTNRRGLAPGLSGVGRQFRQQRAARLHLVFHILTGEKFHPRGVIGAEFFCKLFMGQIFAPQ